MKNLLLGKWSLVEMDQWDPNYINLEKPGYIQFKKDGSGTMHFGCVELDLAWRCDPGMKHVDFSFEGGAEGTAVSGKGWVKMEGNELLGYIAFHHGEQSGFKARRIN